MSFKNHKYKLKAPVIVYADLETILKPSELDQSDNSKTKVLQTHEVFSIGFYLQYEPDNSKSYYKCFRGENAVKWFITELREIALQVEQLYKNPIPMKPLTMEEEREFWDVYSCHICEKPLLHDRVRDHCHLTGKFIN